jgi:hypothetical protein
MVGKAEVLRRAIAESRRTRVFALRNRGGDYETLPSLPPTLREIQIVNTSIRELPSLPPSLTKLVLEHTDIRELPSLPASLTHLRCLQNRHLTKLPVLPSGLQELIVIESPLEELPIVPESVVKLDIALLPNPRRPRQYDDVVELVGKAQNEKRALTKELQETWNASRSLGVLGKTLPAEIETRIGEFVGLPSAPNSDVQRSRYRNQMTRRRQELHSRPLGAPGVGGKRRRKRTKRN